MIGSQEIISLTAEASDTDQRDFEQTFFVHPNIVVEFFGLAGVHKNYDRLLKAKRVFCQRNGYRLIELYIDDLLPKSRLDDILGFLRERPE